MGVIITPYYNPIFAPITFGTPHWIPVSNSALDKLGMIILNLSRAVQLIRYRNPMWGTESNWN